MRAQLLFVRHILAMPLGWRLWVLMLALTNLWSVSFLPAIEGWVVLGSMMLGGLVQATITARLGFVRLLGLGHMHWIPMLAWLHLRLASGAAPAELTTWVWALTAVNGASLVIDVVDVARYILGERQPTVELTSDGP